MLKLSKKCIIFVLCVALFLSNEGMIIFASSISNQSDVKEITIGEIGGYLSRNNAMVANLYDERNFTVAGSGTGYVLEQAENFHDILNGVKSKVVGDNNLEDGPDRVIINKKGDVILVQDKFRTDPSATVREMFKSDGSLRYVDQVSGKPMVYEVAKDQYEYVVNRLKEKISNNEVPGLTDPNQAETIVKKSTYTTKQLQNMAKAGNVDSLVYDSQHGIIYAGSAMGISFVLDFVAYKMNGYSNQDAIKESSIGAIKTGSVVFATYVISSQLAKTALTGLTDSAAQVIVNSLSDDILKQLANIYGINIFADGAAKAALHNELTNKVTEVLSKQIITSSVLVAVLEVPDIIDIFRKRISPQQLLKNLTVTIATVAGSAGGSAIGGAIGSAVGGVVGSIVPGAGTAAGAAVGAKIGALGGGVLGGLGGHALSETALNNLYKGDSEKMYAILTDVYKDGCIDYLLNKEEADEVASKVSNELSSSKLKDMYASNDRNKFAEELLEPLFLETVKKREQIKVATEKDVREETLLMSKGIVFVH